MIERALITAFIALAIFSGLRAADPLASLELALIEGMPNGCTSQGWSAEACRRAR